MFGPMSRSGEEKNGGRPVVLGEIQEDTCWVTRTPRRRGAECASVSQTVSVRQC